MLRLMLVVLALTTLPASAGVPFQTYRGQAGYLSYKAKFSIPRKIIALNPNNRYLKPVVPVVQKTSNVRIQEAVLFSALTATTDMGGLVSHPGPRGNYHTRSTDPYIALPHPNLLGKKFLVRSRKTGRIVELPVFDVGPWSTKDNYVANFRRPKSERGVSDKYNYVPRRGPGVDITPAAWRLLGEDPGCSKAKQKEYTSSVDLIVITKEVTRNGPVIID